MKIQTITKRYGRKVTRNYQAWDFSTELTAEISPTDDPAQAANDLFDQAKVLTDGDVDFVAKDWEERQIKYTKPEGDKNA